MVSDKEFRDLKDRLKRLERVVGGIDQDLSVIQAQRRADIDLLQALRETQIEQGDVLKEHGQTLGGIVVSQDRHERLLSSLFSGQVQHEQMLKSLATGQARQESQLAEILKRLPPAETTD